MAKAKRPRFRVNDRVMLAPHTPLIPAYGDKPFVGRETVLRVSSVVGKGTLRDPWGVNITDDAGHFWHMQPGDIVPAENAVGHATKRMKHRIVTTTLSGLLKALDMTVDELRKDRRYAKARGDEVIVLETKGGNQLHIVDAPPWLVAQDFGPIGVSWAKRAGWY